MNNFQSVCGFVALRAVATSGQKAVALQCSGITGANRLFGSLRSLILVFLACCLIVPSAVYAQTTQWTQRAVSGPSPRGYHAMAYDTNRNTTVLFGGFNGGSLGDTWEWNGSSWPQRSGSGPFATYHHAMAYDAARGQTVLFGGIGLPQAGQTWTWSGSSWTQRFVTGPSPRNGHAMAYDAARRVTVLFGGSTGGGETWIWNGSSWSQRAVSGPSSRWYHAMAYDSARGVVVLFGGASGSVSGETWEWNGTSWTLRSTSGPAPRYALPMAYDALRGVCVIFGGFNVSGNNGDTWEWNGSTWTQRAGSGPGARNWHAMVYDTARAVVTLFGGNPFTGDTWVVLPCTSVSINAQPATRQTCGATSASFSVSASGSSPLTYQWRENGSPIAAGANPSAATPTLVLSNLTGSYAASYDCVVSNPCGSVASNAAVLTVRDLIAPLNQSINSSVCLGTPASLSVSIPNLGTVGPVTYSWTRNGLPIAATAATINIASTSGADSGSYICTATGSCNSVSSTAIQLTVLQPPSVSQQPTNQSVCLGSPASFVVTASGSSPLTFQWTKADIVILGATDSTYTISAVTSADVGVYKCIVTSGDCSVASNAASLALSPTITTNPTSRTACSATSTTFTVAASGSGPLTYQWRRNGGNIAGAILSTYSFNAFTNLAGTYDCVVSTFCGSTTSAPATLTVNVSAAVTGQPASQTGCVGLPVTFSVNWAGNPAPTFQWSKGNIPISGATSGTYTISSVTANDAGV